MNSYLLGSFSDIIHIGKGGEGDVFCAKQETLGCVAFKTYENGGLNRRELEMIRVYSHHPNIVRLLGFLDDSLDQRMGYIMEYMANGCLHDAIHGKTINYPTLTAYSWISQASLALLFLHEHDVLCRDVKPRNMLLSDCWKTVILCDFGLHRKYEKEFTLTGYRGTPLYMAPEVMQSQVYDKSVDVYSMAITIWEILTRRLPFDHIPSASLFTLYQHVVAGERPESNGIEDNEILQLLKRAWNQDPSARPLMKEIVDFFEQRCADKSGVDQMDRTAGGPLHSAFHSSNDSTQASMENSVNVASQRTLSKPAILQDSSTFVDFEESDFMLLNMTFFKDNSKAEISRVTHYFKHRGINTVLNICPPTTHNLEKLLTSSIASKRNIHIPLYSTDKEAIIKVTINILKRLENMPKAILILTPNFSSEWTFAAASYSSGEQWGDFEQEWMKKMGFGAELPRVFVEQMKKCSN